NSFGRKNSGDGDLIVEGGAGLKLLEPGFELDDQEWVEMGSFLFVRLEMRILFEKSIAALKGYRGGSRG
nr:hypothetical protein [Tanacetum cinerariifolium]